MYPPIAWTMAITRLLPACSLVENLKKASITLRNPKKTASKIDLLLFFVIKACDVRSEE